MEYGIKATIVNLKKSSYAKDSISKEDLSNFIDCSAGINPLGFSKLVEKASKKINLELINLYPESSYGLKKAIKDYWENISFIEMDQILLGDGSMELLYKINKLFIDTKSKILGYSPQFSDYIDDVEVCDGIYEYYLLDEKNNFKFDCNLFLEKMNENHKLFYIDNPNNPTGQIIDICDIEKITSKAKKLNKAIIIDEAYGDFMDMENSAVSLINKYDNLIVTRTFSKGLGLAGIRAAYMVTSQKIAKQYVKLSNPYEVGGISRYLAEVALRDKDFIKKSIEKLTLDKKRFIDSLKKLQVVESHMSVPIMVLRHPDSKLDLEEFLLKYKIKSVSGRSFIGLGKNFVRVRLSKDMDAMIKAFKEVEKEI